DASTSNTWFPGIWFARAMAKIESRIFGSVMGVYLLKSGSTNTGATKLPINESTTATIVPQIHQLCGAHRKTKYRPTGAIVPATSATTRPISCSANQGVNDCVANPY